ncbi:hypothetical protein D920_00027 [Enterococcus faecalis 13-SD-W-01]|nr:hypothetical protein D920_00027 [Enterococcus faecalis 13-SD-W-01]
MKWLDCRIAKKIQQAYPLIRKERKRRPLASPLVVFGRNMNLFLILLL